MGKNAFTTNLLGNIVYIDDIITSIENENIEEESNLKDGDKDIWQYIFG